MALQGTLETFALPDVLRLLASTKKSGVLRVDTERGHGEVVVVDGALAGGSAERAPLAEDPADVLFELLRSADGSFLFDTDADVTGTGEVHVHEPVKKSPADMVSLSTTHRPSSGMASSAAAGSGARPWRPFACVCAARGAPMPSTSAKSASLAAFIRAPWGGRAARHEDRKRQDRSTRKNAQRGCAFGGRLWPSTHHAGRSRALARFCAHPVFADLCHDLVGPDARLYWEQAVYKKPERPGSFPWHQDNGYRYVEPQQYLTCWVALTDATRENGCPWLAPGLHRRGTLEHWMTPAGWQCLAEDPPDPLIGGVVDLGACISEFLTLALDPYPRKPGAQFNEPAPAADAETSPFAKLRTLTPRRDEG